MKMALIALEKRKLLIIQKTVLVITKEENKFFKSVESKFKC